LLNIKVKSPMVIHTIGLFLCYNLTVNLKDLNMDEITILPEQFHEFGMAFLTEEEVALCLHMTVPELKAWFEKKPDWEKSYKAGLAEYVKRVKQKQFDVAVNDGSVPMLIHIGKHVLGQGTKVDNHKTFDEILVALQESENEIN